MSDWHNLHRRHISLHPQVVTLREPCLRSDAHALTTPKESRIWSLLGPPETEAMALQCQQQHPPLPHHIPKSLLVSLSLFSCLSPAFSCLLTTDLQTCCRVGRYYCEIAHMHHLIIISRIGPREQSQAIASLIFHYLMFITSPAEDLGKEYHK